MAARKEIRVKLTIQVHCHSIPQRLLDREGSTSLVDWSINKLVILWHYSGVIEKGDWLGQRECTMEVWQWNSIWTQNLSSGVLTFLASWLTGAKQISPTTCFCVYVLLQLRPTAMKSVSYALEPIKLWAKIHLFSFKIAFQIILLWQCRAITNFH